MHSEGIPPSLFSTRTTYVTVDTQPREGGYLVQFLPFSLAKNAKSAEILLFNCRLLQDAIDIVIKLAPIQSSRMVMSPSRSFGPVTPSRFSQSRQSTPAKSVSLATGEQLSDVMDKPEDLPLPELLELTICWDLKTAALTREYKIRWLTESTLQVVANADREHYCVCAHLRERVIVQPAIAYILMNHTISRYIKVSFKWLPPPKKLKIVDNFNRMVIATADYVSSMHKISDYNRADHSSVLGKVNMS